MSFLELLVFGGMIATVGFFVVYTEALRQGTREDELAGRRATYDKTGGTVIFGARTAFFVGLVALLLLTIAEILP